jgi:hypothetical protein
MYKNTRGVRAVRRLTGQYNPHVVAGQRAEERERHERWLQTPAGIAHAKAEAKANAEQADAIAAAKSSEQRRAEVLSRLIAEKCK